MTKNEEQKSLGKLLASKRRLEDERQCLEAKKGSFSRYGQEQRITNERLAEVYRKIQEIDCKLQKSPLK